MNQVPATSDQDLPAPRWRLVPLFFAAGGLALVVQVTLLRELLVALQGDETAVALGLSAWLGGIAVGAAAGRRLARGRPDRWAALGFALLAFLGPLEVVAARLGRWFLAPPPGELLSLGPALLLVLVVLTPPGIMVGLTFTSLAGTAPRGGWRPGQGIAWLYALESLGSLAGGLLVTFLVVPWLGPLQGVFLCAGVWILLGSISARSRLMPGASLLLALGLALLTLGLPLFSDWLDAVTVRARFEGMAPGISLAAWDDTPYQHIAISADTPRHFYAGGQYVMSFPDPAEEEALAHQLVSLTPRPESILLIGSGLLGTLRFMLQHPVERVDLVEIDSRALDFLLRFLPLSHAQSLTDPRVRIVRDDPRRFLSRHREPYDLILVLEPSPVTLLLARFSTEEFFRLCAGQLTPGGVLVMRLETAPTVLTGETAALGGSIWGALRRVFPVVRAGPGPEAIVIAGKDPEVVTLNAGILAQRFQARGITSGIFVPELFSILFPPERVGFQERALEEASTLVPASRDERPVSFLHALALRQQVAGGIFAPLLGLLPHASPLGLGVGVLLPSLLFLAWLIVRADAHRAVPLSAAYAIWVTGACGMGWSLLILFSYQTRAGALYGQIGLLTALFMLGLAVGSMALSGGAELSREKIRRWLPVVILLALAFAVMMPGFLRGMGTPALSGLRLPDLLHGGLLLIAGVLTGGLFPVAAGVYLAERREVGETAGALEAADHWGAALAALLGGTVLIPALGLYGTAWLLAALEVSALLGVLLAWRKERA